jgi:Holliday junction resolvase RusA-like endonuclease
MAPPKKKAKTGPVFWYDARDRGKKSAAAIKLKIRGTPLPLERHRNHSTGGGKQVCYNPSKSKQVAFREAFREALHHAEATASTDRIVVTGSDSASSWSANLRFYFPRPQGQFFFGPDGMRTLVDPNAPKYMTFTPDVDNIVKFVLDSINDEVYRDDKQVVEIHAVKLYQNCNTDSGCIVLKLEKI